MAVPVVNVTPPVCDEFYQAQAAPIFSHEVGRTMSGHLIRTFVMDLYTH